MHGKLISFLAATLLSLTFSSLTFSANVMLSLQCSLSIRDYPGIPDSLEFENVTLVDEKHRLGGTHQVFFKDKYVFWAMTHGIQTAGDITKIVNFQVVIQNVETEEYFHALSDNSNTVEYLTAHISLVKYPKESFWEEGEIMFRCKSTPPTSP